MSGNGDMIEVRLGRIVMQEGADRQFIFLVERQGERGFPIVIGYHEASEIHRVVTGDKTERPLTHQLCQSMLEALDGRIEGVDIVSLHHNTFFAELHVAGPGGSRTIDARPSDAIALGLRWGCPIRVAEDVLKRAAEDEA